MSTATAVLVVMLGSAAVAALVRRDHERTDPGETTPRRSRLGAAAWALTLATLLSAAIRVLIIY